MERESGQRQRLVALVQAGYFLVSGIWLLIHMRSFEWVSGPKTDRWLVKVASVLISLIGATIGCATWRRRLTPEIRLLATGSALSLAIIDGVYVARRRIRWVYLLDAVAEICLIVGWGSALAGENSRAPASQRGPQR